MLEELNKFVSKIQKTDSPVVAGIDEAGRGPVVGPMVYAVYVAPVGATSSFRDSKLLSPKARQDFFSAMGNYALLSIDPLYISSHMLTRSKNLNTIAMEAVVLLLQELRLKCSAVQTVFVDALGDNRVYKAYLEKYFDFKFVVENKADSKYQVVSGASIVAKVTRDALVSPLGCGSGYPSDPTTKKWLTSHFDPIVGFPPCVRHSWAPAQRHFASKKARRLANSLDGFYVGCE